jgi:hypothetical protein
LRTSDLLFYIAYMSHTGLSASTITTYISGISTMHKLNGHTDNTKSFLVTKILEGSKRILTYKQRGAIELIVLINSLRLVDASQLSGSFSVLNPRVFW